MIALFQARVPLRNAEFRFDPDWLPLTDLSLDLLFENDGLYMTGNQGRLGKVNATHIKADIVPLDEDSNLELTGLIGRYHPRTSTSQWSIKCSARTQYSFKWRRGGR